MLIVRPANSDDFHHIKALADKAGPGFTSLAVGDDKLLERLKKSIASFTEPAAITPDKLYILLLEDSSSGEIIGMSAVKAQIGIRDPFFNFRILTIGRKSAVTDRRYDMEVLMMVNEHNGATEVGSLYVLPKMRGTGSGKLISQARYMLMAADRSRFSDTVISELRGHVDEEGFSPFWEAIGRKFFQMDFAEADHTSAEQDSQFILDLMPRYPIYVELLPEAAREVMGKTHPAGIGARKFLEAEGFRYSGMIDIFDGGPSVSAPLGDIRTIKESRTLIPRKSDARHKLRALISNDDVKDFRCIFSKISFDDEQLLMTSEDIMALGLDAGAPVRIWIQR